ncbi:hypothetical protein LguiA_014439 [Lonicera macranthoides]
MAAEHSGSSTLPWIWVIESLASFKQVDASLLIDLVKRTPEISDDMGKNAREMVSFRILESLFVKALGTTNDVASLSDSKIGFDSSERCEDVLRRILDESAGSKLRLSEVEMSKWDVEPFITLKRSCLPKTDLQQLKELILQGNHPLLAPLKERSGLVIANQSENANPEDDGISDGVTEGLERDNSESQALVAIRNLISLSSGNGDVHFPEKPAYKNLLPAKRVRNSSATESNGCQSNGNQVIVRNGCGAHLNAAKKHKHDAICIKQAVGQSSISPQRTELVEDPCGRSSPRAENENLEDNSFLEDNDDGDDASKKDGQSCEVDDPKLLHNQQQIPCSDDKVSQDKFGENPSQNGCVDKAKDDDKVPHDALNAAPDGITGDKDHVDGAREICEPIFQPNATNGAAAGEAGDDVVHNCEPEISSDSDRYDNERTDIATKKHVFLSSQCTYSQDSMTEVNLCMKCNKGGNLMVCSTNTCPLVVHESCLGSAATFDVGGNFYCPFCAYSRAISEYLDLKKKASLARKDLTAFIGLGNEPRQNKISKKLRRTKINKSRKDVDLAENNEANNADNVNRVDNPRSISSTENVHQKEPLVPCSSDDPSCGEKGPAIINGTCSVLTKDKLERQKKGPRVLEEQQTPVQDNREGEKSSHEPVGPPSDDIEGTSEEENDKSVAAKYSVRFRKREKQYTYPSIPQLRRKKLVWTKVEEETLKEGVQRFSNANDKSIPWKKILEFGSDVFLKGRTAIDLKDKWRNLCKGSPRSSK